LLCQFSTQLIDPNSGPNDPASAYYGKLYGGARAGYYRMDDFWEVPQWIAFAAYFLPDADVLIIRDMQEAVGFLQTAGYTRIAFSVLDVNRALVREIAQNYTGQVDCGGYIDGAYCADLPNITWYDSLEEWAKALGIEYRDGADYRHFAGCRTIPRLTLSTGCKFRCAFCDVPKTITETPVSAILRQLDSFRSLDFRLVYLNDKTFGQASNYRLLPELCKAILNYNPEFLGFIVQTTPVHLVKLASDAQWFADSGIRYVELGIETYNDSILASLNKRQSQQAHTDKATALLRSLGIGLIPNIIIGLPGETRETYANTLEYLERNADIISHCNIYNLAVYADTPLEKVLPTASASDSNENTLIKSWITDTAAVEWFAESLYTLGCKMLDANNAYNSLT
jgi:hypothetical protein